jgi:hypothetical protein
MILLLTLVACAGTGADDRRPPTPDSTHGRSAVIDSSVTPPVSTLDSPEVLADADSLRLDAAGRPMVPVVLRHDCEGEDCEWAFAAAVCRPTMLRAAPTESAPIVARLAEGDTIDVERDLHIRKIGVIVLKQTFTLDRDIGDVEEPIPQPRSDTVRLSQGDTIYLIRYLSLGAWRWAYRGRQHDSYEFWSAPPDGEPSAAHTDSSRAAARSEPVREDWWHVRPRRGAPGWWLGNGHDELLSTSDRVRRHDDCPKP